jgi:hypothetical protein
MNWGNGGLEDYSTSEPVVNNAGTRQRCWIHFVEIVQRLFLDLFKDREQHVTVVEQTRTLFITHFLVSNHAVSEKEIGGGLLKLVTATIELKLFRGRLFREFVRRTWAG